MWINKKKLINLELVQPLNGVNIDVATEHVDLGLLFPEQNVKEQLVCVVQPPTDTGCQCRTIQHNEKREGNWVVVSQIHVQAFRQPDETKPCLMSHLGIGAKTAGPRQAGYRGKYYG